MRALGTTLRYAFAGSVIFGVANMVRNLSQIQVQLGQIAAIGSAAGPGGGSIPLTTNQISNLGATVRQASIDSVTPVQDFNDAVLNLYSTIQNVPPNKAAEMVKEFARTAKLVQTDTTTLQQVALQSQFAFHRPHTLEEARRQSREYFSLISSAPGGPAAAPQIFQQLGPLARVFAFGRGTQEQMLGFTLSALRGGGTPATNLRGLQFLMQTVASPDEQTKTSKAAFHRLGITDEFIRTKGVAAAMQIVLKAIRGGGVTGAEGLRGLDDETLGNVEAQAAGDPFAATSALGIQGGGAQLAAQLFHRVHALRTAVGLATRFEAGPGVDKTVADDLRLIQGAAEGHTDDVNNLSKAWDRFQKQSRLPQASQAIQSASVALATQAEEIINFNGVVTKAITRGGEEVNRHPAIALGGILGLGALALRGGRLGLLTGAGRAVGGAAVVGQGLVSGSNVPGGSPQNPLFVFIVGQLSNPFGSRGVRTGGPGMPGGVISTGEEAAQTGGRISRFGRVARIGGRIVGPASWALAGYEIDQAFLGGSTPGLPFGTSRHEPRAPRQTLLEYLSKQHEKKASLLQSAFGIGGGMEFIHKPTGGEKGIIDLFQRGKISGQEAEARLINVARTHPKQWAELMREGVITISGKAKIDVNINQKDAAGKQRTTKKSVTVDLIPDFTPPAPTHRNKKTTRGGR